MSIMKLQILLFSFSSLLLLNCSTAQNAGKTESPAPKAATTSVAVVPAPPAAPAFVTWDKKMVELGKVKKGETRSLFFDMTNTSGGDIQIDIVDACECTKVDFPRSVIHAGEKRRLDVVFDSAQKDAGETIGITIVFKNNDAAGNPRIESLNYSFELEK